MGNRPQYWLLRLADHLGNTLTGKPLADFSLMLKDWNQYSTFPFIGPDDINRLFSVLIAAGLTVTLTDAGNRPQYWLLQLANQFGNNSATPVLNPPSAPVATAATNTTGSSFSANWNISVGATDYQLDVSTSNVFASFVPGFEDLSVGNVTTFSVTGLTPNTTYYFRVRASNTDGVSASSNAVSLMTAFTPAAIPGLAAWWKADSFSLADGTAVGGAGNEWLDQSGSGNDLSQATAGSQPVFKTNIVNGKPVVRFDGVNDLLLMASELTYNGAQQFTVVIIGTNSNGAAFTGGSDNTGIRQEFVTAYRMCGDTGCCDNTIAFTAPRTSFKMFTGRRSTWRENNQNRGGTGIFGQMKFDRVGNVSDLSLPLNGDIAEIVLYSARLTDAEVDQIYTDYVTPNYGF